MTDPDNPHGYRLAFGSCAHVPEPGDAAAEGTFVRLEDHWYSDDGTQEHRTWDGRTVLEALHRWQEDRGGVVHIRWQSGEWSCPGIGTVEGTERQARELLARIGQPAPETPLIERGDVVIFSDLMGLGDALYIERRGRRVASYQGWAHR